MLEIAKYGQRVVDDLMALAAFDVGDEADPAGALAERRIVEAGCRRQRGIVPGLPSVRSEAFPAIPGLAHSQPRVSQPPSLSLLRKSHMQIPHPPSRQGGGRGFGALRAFRCADWSRGPEANAVLVIRDRLPAACGSALGRSKSGGAATPSASPASARQLPPVGRAPRRLLGQQHCPNLACQILTTETSRRLSLNSFFRWLAC